MSSWKMYKISSAQSIRIFIWCVHALPPCERHHFSHNHRSILIRFGLHPAAAASQFCYVLREKLHKAKREGRMGARETNKSKRFMDSQLKKKGGKIKKNKTFVGVMGRPPSHLCHALNVRNLESFLSYLNDISNRQHRFSAQSVEVNDACYYFYKMSLIDL